MLGTATKAAGKTGGAAGGWEGALGSAGSRCAIYWLSDQSLEFSESLKGGDHSACLTHCLNVVGPVLSAEREKHRRATNSAGVPPTWQECRARPTTAAWLWCHLRASRGASATEHTSPDLPLHCFPKEAEPVGDDTGSLRGIGFREWAGAG